MILAFLGGIIVGGIITLVVENNLSSKALAKIKADLDAANAKIASLTPKK